MLILNEVLQLHEKSIKDYGGNAGVRDINFLESAIARPFETFEGTELYATHYEKAAILIEGIVKSHPFFDGNKRTGFIACFTLLYRSNILIAAKQEAVYNFVIDIASSD